MTGWPLPRRVRRALTGAAAGALFVLAAGGGWFFGGGEFPWDEAAPSDLRRRVFGEPVSDRGNHRVEWTPEPPLRTVQVALCLVRPAEGTTGERPDSGTVHIRDYTTRRHAAEALGHWDLPPELFERDVVVGPDGCGRVELEVDHRIEAGPGLDYDPPLRSFRVSEAATLRFVRADSCELDVRTVDLAGALVPDVAGRARIGFTWSVTGKDGKEYEHGVDGPLRPFRTDEEGRALVELRCGAGVELWADDYDVQRDDSDRTLVVTDDVETTLVVRPYRRWRLEVVDKFGRLRKGVRLYRLREGAEDLPPGEPLLERRAVRVAPDHVFPDLPGDRGAGLVEAEGILELGWVPLEGEVRENADGTWTSRIVGEIADPGEDFRVVPLGKGLATHIAGAALVDAAGQVRPCEIGRYSIACPSNVAWWHSLEVQWVDVDVTQSWPERAIPRQIQNRPTVSNRCFRFEADERGIVLVGSSKAATAPPLEGGARSAGGGVFCAITPAGQDTWVRVVRPDGSEVFGVLRAGAEDRSVVELR